MAKQDKKKRGKDASKERIILAAIEVFAKKGYDKATYRAISEVSGLNESLITRYFGSKRGLALATIGHIKLEVSLELSMLPERETFSEELHAISTALISIYQRNSHNIISLFNLIPKDELFWEDVLKDVSPKFTIPERYVKFQDNGTISKDVNMKELMKYIINLFHSVLYFNFLILRMPIQDVTKLLNFYTESMVYGMSKDNKALEFFVTPK